MCNAEFKELNGVFGYYIDDQIQWPVGKDYFRYCVHFDNVFSSLFPPNKVNTLFRHILIVGGGDMQLLSNTTMLSSDCRRKIVDPMIHDYQDILVANKDKLSKTIYRSQRYAYTESAFIEMIPNTIESFLEEDKYAKDTFDLIVVDLTDELAIDENNLYTSKLWSRLRNGGIMIGYGGTSLQRFLANSIIPMLDVTNIVLEEREYSSWGDAENKGIVYGVIKK